MVPPAYFFSSSAENLSQIWNCQHFLKSDIYKKKQTNKLNKELPPVSVNPEKLVLLEYLRSYFFVFLEILQHYMFLNIKTSASKLLSCFCESQVILILEPSWFPEIHKYCKRIVQNLLAVCSALLDVISDIQSSDF